MDLLRPYLEAREKQETWKKRFFYLLATYMGTLVGFVIFFGPPAWWPL